MPTLALCFLPLFCSTLCIVFLFCFFHSVLLSSVCYVCYVQYNQFSGKKKIKQRIEPFHVMSGAMLESQPNPVRVELLSNVNAFFYRGKWLLAMWVKTLYITLSIIQSARSLFNKIWTNQTSANFCSSSAFLSSNSLISDCSWSYFLVACSARSLSLSSWKCKDLKRIPTLAK